MGYAGRRLSVAAEGGATPDRATPPNSNYYSYFMGGDASYSFVAPPEDGEAGSWLERAELGFGVLHTRHKEQIAPIGPINGFEKSYGQTDLTPTLGLGAWDTDFTASYTRSIYDRFINDRPVQALRASSRGANPVVLTLPRYQWRLDLQFGGLPAVTPILGFGYDAYKVIQPPQRTYSAGLRVKAGRVKATAGVDRVEYGGAYSTYYSFGLRAGF